MRPPGEVREAMATAAEQLAAERDAATWRDMAELAGVGYAAARCTAQNMERSGALVRVGAEKRAHSRRWMVLYQPGPALRGAAGAPAVTAETPPLQRMLQHWVAR